MLETSSFPDLSEKKTETHHESEHNNEHKVLKRPDSISRFNVVHHIEKKTLLIAINWLAGLSIFFFGYDQGMMAGVNNAKHYYTLMKFGYEGPDGAPVITNAALQGGIVAIYYFGTLCGALLAGSFGDRFGRIKTIAMGTIWAILGAALQCSAQNHNWMICARMINGVGTGVLNAVVPIYATETAHHTSRGQMVAFEFTLNIFGVAVAYWLEYGCSFAKNEQFVWRFPIAFQILMLIVLLGACWFFPESPRFLVKAGKLEEARYILGRLRGHQREEEEKEAETEFKEIMSAVALESKSVKGNNYLHMLFGIGSGSLHTGRRVQLVVWLQIMQEWTGIAGVTVFSPTIFRLAGIKNSDSQWIAGLNTITYTLSTLVCVYTIDRIGRRMTLFWGAIAQGVTLFLAGGLSTVAKNSTGLKASQSGNAAVAMVFLYTMCFGATWLIVPWLYPAEIFPLQIRGKGNAWGVIGWSLGNGWLTLLSPIMFNAISENTLLIHGACNLLFIPIIWAFYPESNQRTLEEIDFLFAAKSPFVWHAERHFAEIKNNKNFMSEC